MTGIFTYIYHKNQPDVGKYTSPMDAMGLESRSVGGGPLHGFLFNLKPLGRHEGRFWSCTLMNDK